MRRGLALTCLEAALRLVDHVDAAFATYHAAITVPVLQRAERVLDFHRPLLSVVARERRVNGRPENGAVNNHGGRYKDRTCDPFDVNEVLYR